LVHGWSLIPYNELLQRPQLYDFLQSSLRFFTLQTEIHQAIHCFSQNSNYVFNIGKPLFHRQKSPLVLCVRLSNHRPSSSPQGCFLLLSATTISKEDIHVPPSFLLMVGIKHGVCP
jgi:hypothetical protein